MEPYDPCPGAEKWLVVEATCDYTYEGDFERDEMHGSGVFTFASGARYDGQWSHNAYEGRGTYVWADGTSYEGEWAGGVRKCRRRCRRSRRRHQKKRTARP